MEGGGGGQWWWAPLGQDLVKLLKDFGFTSPPVLGQCSLEEALSAHLHKLTSFQVEGVILTEQSQSNAAGAVLKWKNSRVDVNVRHDESNLLRIETALLKVHPQPSAQTV